LFHVGAREYDPRTARWLQRDPIGVGGGHANVYLYCGNEPVNSKDPSGLQPALTSPDTPHGRRTIIQMAMEDAQANTGGLIRQTQWWSQCIRSFPKHHIFPQKFREKFAKVFGKDIIDNFTLKVPDWFHKWLHSGGGRGGWWNSQWENFFTTNPRATPAQIMKFGKDLLERCGLRDVKWNELIPFK